MVQEDKGEAPILRFKRIYKAKMREGSSRNILSWIYKHFRRIKFCIRLNKWVAYSRARRHTLNTYIGSLVLPSIYGPIKLLKEGYPIRTVVSAIGHIGWY